MKCEIRELKVTDGRVTAVLHVEPPASGAVRVRPDLSTVTVYGTEHRAEITATVSAHELRLSPFLPAPNIVALEDHLVVNGPGQIEAAAKTNRLAAALNMQSARCVIALGATDHTGQIVMFPEVERQL